MAPVETRSIDFPIRKHRTRSTKSKQIESDDSTRLVKDIARSPLKQVKSPKPSPLKQIPVSTANSRKKEPHRIALHFNDERNQENTDPNTKKKIAANVTPKKKLEANCINLTPNRLKCASINENQDSLKSDPLASPLRRSLKITSSPPKTEPTKTNSIPTIKILRGTPKKKLIIESDEDTENEKPNCFTTRCSPRKLAKVAESQNSEVSTSPLKRSLKTSASTPPKLASPTSDYILKTPQKKQSIESDDEATENRKSAIRFSPRKLVKVGERSLYRADVSHLVEARRALSTALPPANAGLIGRQKQLDTLKQFLNRNLGKCTSKNGKGKRSIYISGPPGTGKTTSLKHLIKNLENENSLVKEASKTSINAPHCVFVNCMALKSSAAVYSKIAEEIAPIVPSVNIGSSVDAHKKALEELIVGKEIKQPILLVLDEIDQLDSKCHDVLYSLFEWPYLRNSKVVLVGIANSLDLTDRILPRLKVSKSITTNYSSTRNNDYYNFRYQAFLHINIFFYNFSYKRMSAPKN